MTERKLLYEHVMEPATGKAVELLAGQVMRLEQIGVAGQCADFNCFNLHDYKEYFHTGRTRHMHGMHPTTGDFLWSAPPRDRPIAAIIADTVGTNDVLYPRCSGLLYEYQFGVEPHTNCHDIQAEAQREYGLTSDDVHDSFNFFMHTGVDQAGHPFIAENVAKHGDYVEIISLIDLLAVPNVCGADTFATSSFELKPLRLAIYEGLPEDLAQFEGRPELVKYRSQLTTADLAAQPIKADRELYKDDSYVPNYVNYPITLTDVPVSLSPEYQTMLDELVATGEFGETDEDVLRYVFFSWWIVNYMKGPKHLDQAAED
ncbi:DUF1989 domain-containing protein [Candidatus Poriferisocius sp.]|uniref:DUF1989 domain-containing protein n=1 Tax=Candidatus Poriferisocius sp. TaxID=3101276 RepID=UPI003B52FD79